MSLNEDNDHLIYPCLNSAIVKSCNPSCTASLLLAQPPPLISSVERIEDLLARPTLDQYNFDAERQLLARAEKREQLKRQTSLEATKAATSRASAGQTLLSSKARDVASGESDAGDIRLLREIASIKFKKAMTKIRKDKGIEEVHEIKDGDTMQFNVSEHAKEVGLESGKKSASKDKWRENYMPLLYPEWTINGSSQGDTKLKAAKGSSATLRNSETPHNNPNFRSHLDGGSPTEPAQQTKTSHTEDELAAAVEAGNWAEVRTTAALLADVCERECTISSDINNNISHPHPERTYESYEVLESARSHTVRGLLNDGESERQLSLEETRADAEELIRRAMPDELASLSDIMLQFEGRENELIDTLRIMERRMIAQRARAAAHYTTKLEAKARALSSPRSICDVDAFDKPFGA